MTEVKLPGLSVSYRFERLDYFTVEPYEDSYETEDGEIGCDYKFAVVAWGLDTDNVLPKGKAHFCGRFIDFFDTEEEATELATQYAEKYKVSME